MLDAATQANLELVSSRGARDTSLLAALDRTVTPMGGRRLRSWILQPIRDLAELELRQQFIADLLQEPDLLASLRESLQVNSRPGARFRPAQPGLGQCARPGRAEDFARANPGAESESCRNCSIASTLEPISPTGSSTSDFLAEHLQKQLHEMPELAAKLSDALLDDPPIALKEGGIFRDGFNPQLDELRQASRDGKNWITELQEREIASTGIKSLKVRFNSVFGYFIEITKSNLASVPAHYTRKQTTVGGERFITPGAEGNGSAKSSAPTSARGIWNISFSKPCATKR